jgi:hypothetical protein
LLPWVIGNNIVIVHIHIYNYFISITFIF